MGNDEREPFEVDVDRLRRRRTVKWTLHGPDVLAAWVAEMDFDVAEPVRRALLDAIDREDFGYPEADLSTLTGSTARHLERSHGWQVSPYRVFPVADVLSGIVGALELSVAPGAPVVVPTPAYPPFFDVVRLTGRPVVEVPMRHGTGGWTLDLERIGAALTDGARAVLLCSPHNPTGRVFTQGELSALADVVERHGARVVADEVHSPLVLAGATHVPYASSSELAASHTTTVVSASKAWNIAGLKCAQVVTSNHDDAAAWRRAPLFSVPGPTPLGVAATVAAYRDGSAWLDGLRAQLDARRTQLAELLEAHLPDVTHDPPEATFLAWLDCSALGLDDPARHFLDRGRVALSDGPPFGTGNEQHVRLNFATSSELLERIVTAMAASIDRRSPGRAQSMGR